MNSLLVELIVPFLGCWDQGRLAPVGRGLRMEEMAWEREWQARDEEAGSLEKDCWRVCEREGDGRKPHA